MSQRRQSAVLAIALVWIGGATTGPATPLRSRSPATACIGSGSASRPAEGVVDRDLGAAASALLIRHGDGTAREFREAQRERARELARALAAVVALLVPDVADGAVGRLRATLYPAPITPHPLSARGPPPPTRAMI